MGLPAMKYLEGNRKKTQVKFGGLNHTMGAKDGELWDMKNLTGDQYPVLASRKQRIKLMDLDVSGGILHWNGMCYVDADGFYYNYEYKGRVQEGRKTLAAIGPYVVIFPDKYCYNIETDEFCNMQSFWSGEELEIGTGSFDGENYDYIGAPDIRWEEHFKEGDAVTVSGCTVRKRNNRTAVIRLIDGEYLFFDKGTFLVGDQGKYTEEIGEAVGQLEITRTVPDLDYICENQNRLWGCKGNRIFASMPGDPFNWNNREGLETDGWDVDTGSAGSFTGCISYSGYPIFFKEDRIYKVYGSLPSEYQVVDTMASGVAAGSEKSLAVANGVLFYLSRKGVMAYSGGIPQNIGTALGQQDVWRSVAGSDGMKYYICMYYKTGEHGLYVYDTKLGLWFKEDNSQVIGFAYDAGALYMLMAEGALMSAGQPDFDAEMETSEGPVEWFAEFADFTEEDPNKKGICKIQLRLELDAGAKAQVFMMFDSDGNWLKVGAEMGEDVKRSYSLPIVPRRADHYRLKIEGIGGCRIYSLTVETYSGSEFRSREGRS